MREYIILKGKETLIELEKYENILAVRLGIGCELRGKLLVWKASNQLPIIVLI